MDRNHTRNENLGRNQYMLKGPLQKKGYDWWWHNFTGVSKKTGEEKAFLLNIMSVILLLVGMIPYLVLVR